MITIITIVITDIVATALIPIIVLFAHGWEDNVGQNPEPWQSHDRLGLPNETETQWPRGAPGA